MNYKHLGLLLVAGAIVFLPGRASMQSTSLTAQSFNRTTKSVPLSKMARLFSFSEVKKAEFTQAISNKLLITALDQQEKNQQKKALKTEAKFEKESARLSQAIEAIKKNASSPTMVAKLSSIAQDRTTEITALNNPDVKQTEIGSKLAQHENAFMTDITSILASVPATNRQETIQAVLSTAAVKAPSAAEKATEKLKFIARLNDSTSNTALEEGLDGAEDQTVSDIATLDQASIEAVTAAAQAAFTTPRQLVVLTKLANTVPDTAKLAIENAINTITTNIVKSTDALAQTEAVLKEAKLSADVQSKIQQTLADRTAAYQKQVADEARAAAQAQQAAEANKNTTQPSTSASATSTAPLSDSAEACIYRIANGKTVDEQPLTPEQAARIRTECLGH